MNNTNSKRIVMIGSTPMSLNELPMAPALISGLVKNKGYSFEFIDTNLKLFECCNRNHNDYYNKLEILQDIVNPENDDVIARWQQEIISKFDNSNSLLVNVFSVYSHLTAFRFIEQARKRYPMLRIIVGGLGSQQRIIGNDQWINTRFNNPTTTVFGKLMLEAGLIDAWQQDASMSELHRVLEPKPRPKQPIPKIDFSSYNIDCYDWQGHKSVPVLGSFGCVRQCSFCDIIKFYPAYSFVEADDLSKQIVDVYNQTKISRFAFMDSLVNGSMKNFEAFLQNISNCIERGWLPQDFAWSGTYICRSPSKQLSNIHRLLPKSNVDIIGIGVESGSDRVRFEMNKKFTNDDLLSELEAFKKYKVRTELLFFPSWPTETQQDFNETLNLFKRLAPYAQSKVIDKVVLSVMGFALLDGAPIEQNKDQIGLKSGPLPFLWKCEQNPELNYWENLRRRLLMNKVCEHYGIRVRWENLFVRNMYQNIQRHYREIVDYAGPPNVNISNFDSIVSQLDNQHTLQISIVNSNDKPAEFTFTCGSQTQTQICNPGTTTVHAVVVKDYYSELEIKFSFRFGNDYCAQWGKHPGGEYYSLTGLYIENVQVDSKDITLDPFNLLVSQKLLKNNIPDDYFDNVNLRCIVQDTDLTWTVPSNSGIHANILQHSYAEEHRELDLLTKKLYQSIKL